jgi:hypothetical protein
MAHLPHSPGPINAPIGTGAFVVAIGRGFDNTSCQRLPSGLRVFQLVLEKAAKVVKAAQPSLARP